MSDAKKHLFRLATLFTLLTLGVSLSGCADSLLPKVKKSSVKILKTAIEMEFNELTREFDRLDQKGSLELCAPLHFGVARFAVYQAVEEKRTATMAQLTRFIMRARAAIKRAEEKMEKKQCVDQDGDGLTDLAEYRIHNTKPDNADTDGDKVSDALEIRRYRTDPLKADTDGDMLDDGDEISRGLSPILADSDGDGFIDGIEIANGSNARDVCSQPLDAQYVDRPDECGSKQVHPKPAQVQMPQKRAPEPAPKTKQIPRKKRIPKAEKRKARPSTKPTEDRTRIIENANFEKKTGQALNRNALHPEQNIQAPVTRHENTAIASHKKPQIENTHSRRNHLPLKTQNTIQQIVKKVNAEKAQSNTSLEDLPIQAPVAVNLMENPEKTESPATVPPTPEPPKPAKKKNFPSTYEAFPSTIFLRLW